MRRRPRAATRERSVNRLLAPGRRITVVRRRRYRVEHRLVIAICFRIGASALNGAIGLMQLMPETAERLGVDHGIEQNVDGAVRYLASQPTFKSVDLSPSRMRSRLAEKSRRGHVGSAPRRAPS
jgi:hypothetical protein